MRDKNSLLNEVGDIAFSAEDRIMFGGDSPPGYNNGSLDTEVTEWSIEHMGREALFYDFSDVK